MLKKRIIRLIAILSCYIGIIDLFYFLNRRAKRVITFHNIIPAELLPRGKKIGLVDTTDEFTAIIKEVIKRFPINNDFNNPRSITFTFDDGYLNQSESTFSILKSINNSTATIFLSKQLLNNTEAKDALIIDLLMHWIELSPNGNYKLPKELYSNELFSISTDNRQEVWQNIIWPAFNRDNKTKGRELLLNLHNQYPISDILSKCEQEYLRLRLCGISEHNVEKLQRNGWIIGFHTISHYPLSKLSEEEQHNEIIPSHDFMKSAPFSYPYGELNTVSESTIGIVKKNGYSCAFSNLPYINKYTGKYFMPRLTLSSDKYLLHFELSGLKHFLTTGRLLPVFV